MKHILIVGSSGHAQVLFDLVNVLPSSKVVGCIDDFKNKGEMVHDVPVLGKITEIAQIAKNIPQVTVVIAIGDNWQRRKVATKLQNLLDTITFATLVHPRAIVAQSANIAEGSVVLAGAIVSSGVNIGKHCILNSASVIEHESIMSDYSSLAPGVVTGGAVSIGTGSAVSIGATILQGRSVGEYSVIGAGAVVTSPIPSGVVAYGVPAKVIRKRAKAAKYL